MAFPKWSDKDPDETLDYNVNWSPRMTSPDVIVTSQWIVPAGLTVENEDMADDSTTIWLSGGTLAANYEVLNRVTTAEGRIMDQTVTLKMKTK